MLIVGTVGNERLVSERGDSWEVIQSHERNDALAEYYRLLQLDGEKTVAELKKLGEWE